MNDEGTRFLLPPDWQNLLFKVETKDTVLMEGSLKTTVTVTSGMLFLKLFKFLFVSENIKRTKTEIDEPTQKLIKSNFQYFISKI